MSDLRLEQQSGLEYEQVPVTVMTEVLDNVTKVPGAWGAEKEEFMACRDADILNDDKLQHNHLCIGEPGVGKTALTADVAVHTFTTLVDCATDEMPDMTAYPKMPNGAPLAVLAYGWSDVIRAAVRSGAVSPKPYGEWDDHDLAIITRGAGRAASIARKGHTGVIGTDGYYTSTNHMDIAMVTAARNCHGDLVGKNRFYTAAEDIAKDPVIGPRLHIAAVVTDAESLLARMTSRIDIAGIQSEEELYMWMKAYGLSANDKDMAWLLQYLPKSFADVKAASILRRQMNETILALNHNVFDLSEAHAHLLDDEVALLNEGQLLIDPDVIAGHDERNNILTQSFYPHIMKYLVPEERGLICANPDTAQVTIHPSVMRKNWIDQLHAFDPKALFTP